MEAVVEVAQEVGDREALGNDEVAVALHAQRSTHTQPHPARRAGAQVVAYVDRQPVGCGALRPTDQETGEIVELDYLTKPIGSDELAEALLFQGLACDTNGEQCADKILVVDDEPVIHALLKKDPRVERYAESGYDTDPLELKDVNAYLVDARDEAREKGDLTAVASLATEIEKISEEQKNVNKQIAYYGRRLECHFGLFSHYGDIAKDPKLSTRFQGKDFILNQLDNIEMIRAEFNAMIEEGMKLSMEDMDDMMDEMRDKMRMFKEQKGKKGIFSEME